jgi:hypothetical protein
LATLATSGNLPFHLPLIVLATYFPLLSTTCQNLPVIELLHTAFTS